MIVTPEATISARLARALLESLDAAGTLTESDDLCLVRATPGLDDAPLPLEIVVASGRRWKLAAVEGDLALRVALIDADGGPLLAFTSRDEDAFQADLRERAVLRRTIRPQARHLFSALVGIESTALDDDRFTPPLRELLAAGRRDAILGAIRGRTWAHLVRESDAAAVLCVAAFGFDDRYTESFPGDLWASWLREPPFVSDTLTPLASEILRLRYPLYAKLLAAARDGDVAREFSRIASHAHHGDPALAQLARDAARLLRQRDPERLRTLLAEAESAYIAAGSPDTPAPLLAGAVAAKARRLALLCRSDRPPTTADVDVLSNFVFADQATRETLVRLARLARGLQLLDETQIATTLHAFAEVFRDQLAWLDRSARRAREVATPDPEIAAVREDLAFRWYALRDRWNEAFAVRLASQWSKLFAFPGVEGPLVVSDLLKYVIRPQLADRKTFLIVLDGCDVPTFLEIASAFYGAGATPASFDLALSAIPTVTGHARRALFGGGIPNDKIGDDDCAADASEDHKAFEGPNPFLDGFARKLFLKGDLGDGGADLTAMLQMPESAPQLVAAVFNDIDDAIASKEHSVLAERTLERCTKAFRDAFFAALENGWSIVITADHGHTPYRQPDLKASTEHARFTLLKPKTTAPAGTVVFEIGAGLPYRVAALWQLGAHAGPQHLGYHGGASLEEMLVPLVVYDRSNVRAESLLPPSWWDDAAIVSLRERPAPAIERIPTEAPSSIRVQARAVLAKDPLLLQILERLNEAGFLDATQLGNAVGLPPARIRFFVTGLIGRLRAAGIEPPVIIEDEPLVFRWIGPR